MSDGGLNRDAIRAFWAERARLPTTRWTPSEMLEFELGLLAPLAASATSVLDLGSGHGELSRLVAGGTRRLVAIDWEPAFARSFDRPNEQFCEALVTEFSTSDRFDLVLLFGVVTSLEVEEENSLYRRMASWLAPRGTAVVKNQCSVGEAFVVDTYSEALTARYSGRYPSEAEQLARIQQNFASVEVVHYPPELNRWENSRHVAFVCRGGQA